MPNSSAISRLAKCGLFFQHGPQNIIIDLGWSSRSITFLEAQIRGTKFAKPSLTTFTKRIKRLAINENQLFTKLKIRKYINTSFELTFKPASKDRPEEVAKALLQLLQDDKNGALIRIDSKGLRYV
ncbi:hypothetical protein TNCV_3329191 [Trichonephila clavipes]|nr:hypothetical protein TNCV_3329191 [Trichonephila clavipes]